MPRSLNSSAAGRRLLVVALLVTTAVAVIAPSLAHAAVSLSRAEIRTGTLRLEGRAIANRTITADGVSLGRSSRSGSFRLSRSSYRPPADCTVDVNDGSATPAVARLTGCTVTSTPPPSSPAPGILPSTATIGPGIVGQDFTDTTSNTINMTNAVGPVRWEVTAGALPAGLSIVVPEPGGRPSSPEGDTFMSIDGIPTTAGTSLFTLRATDANGLTASRTYSITITAPSTLAFDSDGWTYVLPLIVGEPNNRWFLGSGGVLPYRWSLAAGTLPPGMTIIQDSPGGAQMRVGGTPTQAGTFAFTMRVTDARAATFTKAFSLTVSEPGGPAAPTQPTAAVLSTLSLSPTSLTGGASSTATVTLDGAAPTAGGFVTLASGNTTAATVPPSVTVPPGATSATFTVSTSAVGSTTSSTISATYGGVTRSVPLTVNAPLASPAAPSAADTVSITRAEYDSGKRVLRVAASSSASGATLRVHVTSTNALVGTVSGGRGEFSLSSNPRSITVRSSLGGSATRTVAAR
jgi:Putative Ig domain